MTSQKFGQSTVIEFNPTAGTYKLTNTEGQTVTVGSAERVAGSPTDKPTFRKVEGALQHDIVIGTPTIGGVAFSYSRIVAWNILDSSGLPFIRNRFQFHVIGQQTAAADMPKTGTGSYDLTGAIGATGYDPVTFTGYNFQPNSTGTFEINFGSGSITSALRLIGVDETGRLPNLDLGSYTGAGALTAGGPAFSGSFSGGPSPIASSAFEGAFFGPAAAEMNYVFHIDTSRVDVGGTVSGRKR